MIPIRILSILALLIVAVLLVGWDNKLDTPVINQAMSSESGPTPVSTQPGETRKMVKISVEEARAKAPFKVLEPSYLPADASYDETRYIEFDGQVFVVLQYKFSDLKRYFQVDQYSPAMPETELSGTKEVQIGGSKVSALFQHGFTVIRWTQDGTRLMLNGAIGEEEALKVARSFR